MQDEATVQRLIIVPLKWLKSSNIWEQFQQVKVIFRRKLEQIEVRECLLSFGTESFVFQCAIQKLKDYSIQNCNFACCFIWV